MNRIYKQIICKLKSIFYTRYRTSGTGRILFSDYKQKLVIVKGKNAKVILNGHLICTNFYNDNSTITITIGNNATFVLNGDFKIGAGVKLFLANNSLLEIEGVSNSSASGITGDTIIMAKEKIQIGKDFICAWNVYISDSDWHTIEGSKMTSPIKIGDKVWVANNCNVLKGSIIGNGCIIGSNTKTNNKTYPDQSLIVGERGEVVKQNIVWQR